MLLRKEFTFRQLRFLNHVQKIISQIILISTFCVYVAVQLPSSTMLEANITHSTNNTHTKLVSDIMNVDVGGWLLVGDVCDLL